jgi:serine acetyltransferase
MGRLSIGDDVLIGANAMVNFNVPSNSTPVGSKTKSLQNELNPASLK